MAYPESCYIIPAREIFLSRLQILFDYEFGTKKVVEFARFAAQLAANYAACTDCESVHDEAKCALKYMNMCYSRMDSGDDFGALSSAMDAADFAARAAGKIPGSGTQHHKYCRWCQESEKDGRLVESSPCSVVGAWHLMDNYIDATLHQLIPPHWAVVYKPVPLKLVGRAG